MGYGKKYDFTKDLTVSPGSTKYNFKTIFDKNREISYIINQIPTKK